MNILANIAVVFVHAVAACAFISCMYTILFSKHCHCDPLVRRLVLFTCIAGILQAIVFITLQSFSIASANALFRMHPLWTVFDYLHAVFTLVVAFSFHVYTHWVSFTNPRYDRRRSSPNTLHHE